MRRIRISRPRNTRRTPRCLDLDLRSPSGRHLPY
ncbi:7,8-dihydro-6-hydroxymethylpterin-pyrophosphokinase [Planotetraspora sp. GP83]